VTTLAQHVWQVVVLLVVVAGPIPFSVFLAGCNGANSRRAPRAHGLLTILTLWCLLQVAVGLALGASGHFERVSLAVAEGAMLTGGALSVGRATVRTLASLGTARRDWNVAERLLGSAWFVVGLTMFAQVGLVPINETDSLSYHMPAMAQWYQSHAFVMPGGVMATVTRYPYDWEALCALFLLPFGDDFLVASPNVLAWLVFGLSIYVTSIELGARRVDALAGTLLASTLPVTRGVLTTMHVDLPLAAFFMAGLYFALVRDALLLFAALGLVLGIKTTGIVYGALLGLVVVVRKARGPRQSNRARGRQPLQARRALAVGLVGIASVLAGAFWYGKNTIEVGNPLGAVRVAVGGHTIFPGPADSAELWESTLFARFDPTRAGHWGVVFHMMWKSGGVALGLLTLAALAAFAHGPPGTRCVRRGLVAMVMVTAMIYVTTPFSGGWRIEPWIAVNFRYSLPCLGVLSLLGTLGFSWMPLREELVAASAVVVGPGRLVTRTMVGAGLLAAAGRATWGAARQPRLARGGVTRTALVVLTAGVMLFGGTLWLRRAHASARTRRYGPIFTFLATGIGPDETVGYLQSQQEYLFYGSDFRRRVLYVPRAMGTREAWLTELRRLRVNVVAVGPIEAYKWVGRSELAWLDDPAGPFVRVFGHDPSEEAVFYRPRDPARMPATSR